MAVLKRIGLLSALKVGFLVYAGLGLIAGLFCTGIALAGIPFAPHANMHLMGALSLLPLIVCPLLWGIVGGLFTGVGVLIFNLASRWVGGVEVEIQ
jgi:hypothetical protein